MDFTSTPFNNKGKIAGDGNIILNTTFNNDGVVANNMNLTSNAVLNSKYENITGRVELNHADAEYHITNSEVVFSDAERIGGSAGKLFVGGNIVSDTSLDYTGQVYLTNGARITPTANGDAFQNVGRLIIGTGEDDIVNATLNILNGKVDAMDYMTNTELSIGTQSSLNVEME